MFRSNKLNKLFQDSLDPRTSQAGHAYLNFLGQHYINEPYAGMVYDSIVRAQEMLCGDNPSPAECFADELSKHSDYINKSVLAMAAERLLEHFRLCENERQANQICHDSGLLERNQGLNFKKYYWNKLLAKDNHYLKDTPLSKLLTEIEVSNHIITTYRRTERQRLAELEYFNDWMVCENFQTFIQIYNRLQRGVGFPQSVNRGAQLEVSKHAI